jgi:hypothetical protein
LKDEIVFILENCDGSLTLDELRNKLVLMDVNKQYKNFHAFDSALSNHIAKLIKDKIVLTSDCVYSGKRGKPSRKYKINQKYVLLDTIKENVMKKSIAGYIIE